MVRVATAVVAAAATLLTTLPLVSAETPAGTVKYSFEKRYAHSREDLNTRDGVERMLNKRQTSHTLNAELSSALLFYVINVTVGTPPQPLALLLDTGSSDVWFPSASSSICRNSQDPCAAAGSFDSDSSSTYNTLDYPQFEISYVDGSETSGTYFTDTLRIGSTSVTNLTMAAASTFDRAIGIMGVGFAAGESSTSGRNGFTYPNIIDQMKSEGIINQLAYSLWLDDANSSTGSILFGGVDTAKYTGSLVSLPIQLDTQTNSYSSFTVAWTGLTVTGSGNNADLSPSTAQPAILDSGTSLTYLPDDIATRIFNGLGVIQVSDELNVLPCRFRSYDISLNYMFGGSNGAKISIPVGDLLIDLVDQTTGQAPTVNGVEYCQFGIAPAGNYPILFGDTFLRSAYVVYDLENREIGLGQTNFNAQPGEQSVVAFSTSGGIPDATMTATGVSVAQTNTGRPNADTSSAGNVAGITGNAPSPTFKVSATSTPNSAGALVAHGKNTAGPGVLTAAIAVTLSAFLFGTMLI